MAQNSSRRSSKLNPLKDSNKFIIIGENIHTTRVVKRNGKRSSTLNNGTEVVSFLNKEGNQDYLPVTDSHKKKQSYQQGHIKHMMLAIENGMSGSEEAVRFLQSEILAQELQGVHFLDLNIDEISYKQSTQIAAMEWLVDLYQTIASIPPSIDSSSMDIIQAGLSKYNGALGRPLINSAALERIETLDLVREHKAQIVVTAAGREGMPSNTAERLQNARAMIEEAIKRNIELSDIFVDLLVFPISVNKSFGTDYLNAVAGLRREFGQEIHIIGGLSNVSFGLPKRKLINTVFTKLAIQNGADGGIIDPIQTSIEEIVALDLNDPNASITTDMLMGRDEFCVEYLKAFRTNKL